MIAISLFEVFIEFMTSCCALILSFTQANSKFYFLVISLFLYLQIPFSIFIAFIIYLAPTTVYLYQSKKFSSNISYSS